MCEEILDPGRAVPIVGLTCRPGARDPALPVDRACEVVWAGVPIYVIEPQQARELGGLLPEGLGAYNGAVRVWMPGVSGRPDASWHPLIYDSTGIYGEDALRRLASEFAIKPPGAVDLTREQQALAHVCSAATPVSEAVLRVGCRKDLRRLLCDLRGGRDHAVVILTVGARGKARAFPPGVVRAEIKDPAAIYVLETPDLCRRLAHALGPLLAVDGGDARVLWPGAGPDSDPAGHPLVPADSPDDDGRGPVERLTVAFELSRPLVRRYLTPIQTRVAALEERSAGTLGKLRESETRRRKAVERAEAAETHLAGVQRELAALRAAGLDTAELQAVAGMDPEAIMQRLICREWLSVLEAADRREHPLGAYRLAPQFTVSVEDPRIATPATRVAFACAMIACRRAAELPGLEPHPRREGKRSGGGDDPQAVREDGAKAWMCNLGHGRGAPRLLYWQLPDGTVEFDSVRNHDAIGRP